MPSTLTAMVACLPGHRGTAEGFVACDFSVDHSGVWWHLEVNPAGQWAWDHPLREGIASAIADALTGEKTPP